MYRTETFGCDAARKNKRRGEGHAQAEGLGVCKETNKEQNCSRRTFPTWDLGSSMYVTAVFIGRRFRPPVCFSQPVRDMRTSGPEAHLLFDRFKYAFAQP